MVDTSNTLASVVARSFDPSAGSANGPQRTGNANIHGWTETNVDGSVQLSTEPGATTPGFDITVGVDEAGNKGVVITNKTTGEALPLDLAKLKELLPEGFSGSVQVVLSDEPQTVVTLQVASQPNGDPQIDSAIIVSGNYGVQIEGISSDGELEVTNVTDEELAAATKDVKLAVFENPGQQTDAADQWGHIDSEYAAVKPFSDAKTDEEKAQWINDAEIFHVAKEMASNGASQTEIDAKVKELGMAQYDKEFGDKGVDADRKAAGEQAVQRYQGVVQSVFDRNVEQAYAEYDAVFLGPPDGSDPAALTAYESDRNIYAMGQAGEALGLTPDKALAEWAGLAYDQNTSPQETREEFINKTVERYHEQVKEIADKQGAGEAGPVADPGEPPKTPDEKAKYEFGKRIGEALAKWIQTLPDFVVAGFLEGLAGDGSPVSTSQQRSDSASGDRSAPPGVSAFGWAAHAA